jgi:CHAD domain-containing protein
MAKATEGTITKLILKHTSKIIYFCDAENISGNLTVHEIRKSFKRIRAWLSFFRNIDEGKPIVDGYLLFQDINKQLGSIRESFVNLSLFEKHFSNKKFLPERKVKQITDNLFSINQKQLLHLSGKGQIFEYIKKDIALFEQTINSSKKNILNIATITNELSESYAKSLDFYYYCKDDSSSENLHKLRKKLKQLWHQFEIVKFFHPKYFALKNRQLNLLTELLGMDHDNYVLSKFIKENLSAMFEKEEQNIFDNLIQHQHELALTNLQPKLKHFFSEEPEKFKYRINAYLGNTEDLDN